MMNHEYCLVMDAWIREAQEATKLVEDIESRIKNKDLAEENRLRDIAQSKLIEAGVKLDRLESLLHNPPSKPALTREDSEFRWKMLSDLQLRTRALALRLYTSTKRAGGFLASTTTGTSRATNSLDQALDSFITKLGHPKRYSGQIYEERVGMVRSAVYPIIRSIKPPSYIVLSGFVALASDPKLRYCSYFARSGLNHHKLFNLQESEKEVALQIRSRAAHAAYFRVYNPRSSAGTFRDYSFEGFKDSGSFVSTSLIKKVCWTFCLILGAAALLFVLVIISAEI
ncbi:hypothetical protein POTOM_043937 [Populus tomentosa]|uniref:Uncharacterized protein n=1 Tax=Populus tomentosa TaxID=118781 RepID=A0A8X7YEQ4_POPTO|nr:hypothetical protein POTOM_043937 [Populus tomentosa]